MRGNTESGQPRRLLVFGLARFKNGPLSRDQFIVARGDHPVAESARCPITRLFDADKVRQKTEGEPASPAKFGGLVGPVALTRRHISGQHSRVVAGGSYRRVQLESGLAFPWNDPKVSQKYSCS